MKVLVIGAGGTGKSIIQGLSKIRNISKIYVMNRTLSSSKKVVNEINNSKVEPFIKNNFLPINYIILSLSAINTYKKEKNIRESKNTYEIRQKELKANLLAVKKSIHFLNTFSKKVKIIIVTNPVDGIENYLTKKLPNKEIFGFGLQLDVNRYSKYFNKKIIGVGVHGKTIPILNLKKSEDYDKLYKKVDNPLLNSISKNGLPYSIYSEEFKKYFKKIISKKKELIYTSTRLKTFFYGIKNISIGLPFYIQNGKIIGIKNIKLSIIEQDRLKKDVKILKDSIKIFL